MPPESPRRKQRWLILPPIAIGIAILVWLAQGREPPARVDADERAHAVRVIEAQALDLVPTAEGYGPVRPAKVWKAVAQVAGRIIEVHPRLRDGEILAAGTELLRIDPIDYELALAQAEAELAELAVEEENVRASLEIEERNRGLADQELERLRALSRQRTVSDSDVDQAERTALTTRGAVQTLKNQLTLIPTQRRLLESQAARAERDLERTRIRAPFDLRIANLEVEADQYVGVGQTLFEGDAVDRVEMDIQVPLYALRRLFLDRPELVVEPTRISEQLPAVIGLDPLVRLDLGDTGRRVGRRVRAHGRSGRPADPDHGRGGGRGPPVREDHPRHAPAAVQGHVRRGHPARAKLRRAGGGAALGGAQRRRLSGGRRRAPAPAAGARCCSARTIGW
jgi:multidrug efflux pump subunit AcrA (membrane-fusion protein)